MYADHYGWMGFGMWIFWIFLIVIIVLIVKVLTEKDTMSLKKSPMEILKERYAHGDIDDEFQRHKRELEK